MDRRQTLATLILSLALFSGARVSGENRRLVHLKSLF